MTRVMRMILVCACLALSLSAFGARAEAKPLDLTNTVWEGTDEEYSFTLTFVQGNTERNNLVASLDRTGSDTLELRGQFSPDVPDSRIHLVGERKGETVTLDLRIKISDPGDKPYFYGDISTRSATYHVSARCDNQCPGAESNGEGSNDQTTRRNAQAALLGQWEDTSEEIGFKEYWSVKLAAGQWKVSGKFVKDDKVVGEFHGEEIVFDSTKGSLTFLQVFDLKPNPRWIDSNDVEAAASGDRLKIRVRNVDAVLNRSQHTQE